MADSPKKPSWPIRDEHRGHVTGQSAVIGHLTLPALGPAHRGLAGALAVQLVAQPDHADGAVPVTLARLAALGRGGAQVPEQRLAGVADAARDGGLAGAELALGHLGAAPVQGEEGLGDAVRVTVALLAQRVVEPVRGALVALLPHEVWFAVAHARVAAGHPRRADTVAVTF